MVASGASIGGRWRPGRSACFAPDAFAGAGLLGRPLPATDSRDEQRPDGDRPFERGATEHDGVHREDLRGAVLLAEDLAHVGACAGVLGTDENVLHHAGHRVDRAEQAVDRDQEASLNPARQSKGLERRAHRDERSDALGGAAGEGNADVAAPGVTDPVDGVEAERIEDLEGGLGAFVDRESAARARTFPVRRAVDDDHVAVGGQRLGDHEPASPVHEQAVPEDGGRTASGAAHMDRTESGRNRLFVHPRLSAGTLPEARAVLSSSRRSPRYGCIGVVLSVKLAILPVAPL